MKNYKDFPKVYIGSSDIASLTVRAGGDVTALNFGEDGAYYAYIVTERAEIGEHYKKMFSTPSHWIAIYDDDEKVFTRRDKDAQRINIYRAGEFGCIIEFEKEE